MCAGCELERSDSLRALDCAATSVDIITDLSEEQDLVGCDAFCFGRKGAGFWRKQSIPFNQTTQSLIPEVRNVPEDCHGNCKSHFN